MTFPVHPSPSPPPSIPFSSQVGTVWSNCWMLRSLNVPFGGMKLSGQGREGAEGSRHFYTEEKTICIKYT